MYKCKYCHIQSEYKYNIDRHEKRHNANTAPTTMYVDDNNPPTKIGSNVQQNQMQTNKAPVTMSLGDNVERAPTTMYEYCFYYFIRFIK